MTRRVLMTADAVGGVWTFALELAQALGPCGWHVALAVMGPAPAEEGRRDAARVPGLELYHRPGRLEWMDDPWDDVREAGEWLLDLESRLAPDVVHVNGYCHAALPWQAPALVTAHSCVTSWWRAVHGGNPPAAWGRYTANVARGLRAAAMVTAPTAAMLAALEACYGPLPRTRVIPNGRLPQTRRTMPSRKAPLVLSAGRLWDEAKNVRTLCAAAAQLPWPVIVAGEAGDGSLLRGTHVRWLGPLSPAALADRMRHAAIYALPARYEPFGLSALEAALAGCALVLGDIPSLREVWGDAALFVPPDDAAALAGALRALIADEPLRVRMSDRAHARARRFTPDRMASGYDEVYRDITGWPAAAAARAPGGPLHGPLPRL